VDNQAKPLYEKVCYWMATCGILKTVNFLPVSHQLCAANAHQNVAAFLKNLFIHQILARVEKRLSMPICNTFAMKVK